MLSIPLIFAGPALAVIFGALVWLRWRVRSQQKTIEELKTRLERQTMTDEATGLLNRHCLDLEIEREIERARRYQHPLAGMMVDIDNFKAINENRGHVMADLVLKRVAMLLQNSIRKVDIAGRYGGDEFMIILPEATLEGATVVAQRIQESVRNHRIEVPRPALSVTVSIGLFAFPDTRGLDTKTFVQIVDLAMLKAKKAGKDRIVTG